MIASYLSRFWAFFVAFAVAAALLPPFIAHLRRARIGQSVREEGPETHLAKEGTPAMGGVVILLAIVAASLITIPWSPQLAISRAFGMASPVTSALLLLCVLVAFGLVGFADDYLNATQGRSLGLKARHKLFWQFIIATAFVVIMSHVEPSFGASTNAFGRVYLLGWLYWPFAILLIVGMSNAVNITDGLDGLVAGLVAIAAAALATTSLVLGNFHVVAVLAATAGACLAFLWFNANPARIFMGDTGSLALGGLLAAAALQTGQGIPLLIIGFVFVAETTAVAMQVTYFKYTKRKYGEGRRIWKMTPLHHHFELSGWPEQKVVVRFWIIGLLFAVLGILSRADWRHWIR